jgi:hypothetical protein
MADYTSDKPIIRSKLLDLARAGEVTYYGVLGAPMQRQARWPGWKIILDEISREETAKGEPDVTYLVLNASNGWPGQIGFSPTDGKPTDKQKTQAQSEIARVFQR